MKEVYEEVLRAIRENRLYATATVVSVEGAVPRRPGSKMVLLADGSFYGTVGGGVVELAAAEDCRSAMKSGGTVLKTYDIPSPNGSVTGRMTLFIEPGRPLPYLYLCGCGHVAQAILPLAKSMGYYTVGYDARDVSSFGDALKPLDELHILPDFESLAEESFVPGSAVIICSYSHQTDGVILKAVMDKEPAYVGMLGGKPKIRGLFRMLLDSGHSREELEKIYAPLGLNLGGETPAEIAIAAAAELLAVKNGKKPEHLRDVYRPSVFPL